MPDAMTAQEGYECRICGFEWDTGPVSGIGDVCDANGTSLADGDNVTIVKDLKLDGKSGGIKVGTKVRSIRLVEGDHPISGKVNGRDTLIRAEFVKKAK